MKKIPSVSICTKNIGGMFSLECALPSLSFHRPMTSCHGPCGPILINAVYIVIETFLDNIRVILLTIGVVIFLLPLTSSKLFNTLMKYICFMHLMSVYLSDMNMLSVGDIHAAIIDFTGMCSLKVYFIEIP
jgi:hypothetical protein